MRVPPDQECPLPAAPAQNLQQSPYLDRRVSNLLSQVRGDAGQAFVNEVGAAAVRTEWTTPRPGSRCFRREVGAC